MNGTCTCGLVRAFTDSKEPRVIIGLDLATDTPADTVVRSTHYFDGKKCEPIGEPIKEVE